MGSCRFIYVNLCQQFNKLSLLNNTLCVKNTFRKDLLLSQFTNQSPLISWRFSHSFFSRLPAEKLWKSVTSVSNAGRKRGRGKGSSKKLAKDLNRGQVIGFGKKNMLWPGLNAPIIQGREVLRQQELPPDEARQKRILELRDKFGFRRSNWIHPLERGWSGTKLPGRSLGPPSPVGDENFEGFDSRCLEFKVVAHMHGQRGKVRRLSAFVVVGNNNGLGGFALAKSNIGMAAAKKARNRAAKRLRYIERDNNTVIHDFYSEYGPVRLFVERRPEGYGLNCHRAIKCICQVLGIKDLYVKTEGSTSNIQCLTRAFFIGLMKQKSLKQIADEKSMHIVRFQENRDNFPEVVASPEKCLTEEELSTTQPDTLQLYLHKGKVVEERKKYQPFFINFPCHIKAEKEREKLRNQRDVQIHMIAKYGNIRRSWLTVREEEKARQELKDTVEEQS